MARMRRSATLTGMLILAAALALSGCATGGGGSLYGGAPTESADDEISAGAAAGTWGDATDSAEPSLELDEDGTLTGTDGCNRLTGEWVENGVDLTFENVATTLMACPDADTWLSGLDTATIDGSTMTVFDESGKKLGTLERSED
jgi:heat shock protein HslJ